MWKLCLYCERLNMMTSVREERLRRMISIVACCHGAKLCAHAAQDFRLQQYHKQNSVVCLKSNILSPTKFFVTPKFLGWLRYCLQGQVVQLASGLFYCWSLSCNNNMPINLHMFTSRYDVRRFVAFDSWMQTSVLGR